MKVFELIHELEKHSTLAEVYVEGEEVVSVDDDEEEGAVIIRTDS